MRSVLVVAGVCGLAVIAWLRAQWMVVTVTGQSMAPTYADGQRVLVRRRPARRVRQGEVVVVDLPPVPDVGAGSLPRERRRKARRWIVKRTVAIPGDLIPEECCRAVGATPEDRVPEGQLLVRGDNAEGSHDSRAFGYVGADLVLGIALRRLASDD